MDEIALLQQLQDELAELKRRHGKALTLKRAAGEDSPFPIRVTLLCETPPPAQNFDVDGLKVQLVLHRAVLHPDSRATGRGLQAGISTSQLPPLLRQHIAQQLLKHWKQQQQQQATSTNTRPGSPQLGCIFSYLQAKFVELISALPQYLEPYQGVNAAGATVRRYAIISEADEQGHAAAPGQATELAAGGSDAAPAGEGDAADAAACLSSKSRPGAAGASTDGAASASAFAASASAASTAGAHPVTTGTRPSAAPAAAAAAAVPAACGLVAAAAAVPAPPQPPPPLLLATPSASESMPGPAAAPAAAPAVPAQQPAADTLPTADSWAQLLAELQWLARRYGSSFAWDLPEQQPQGCAAIGGLLGQCTARQRAAPAAGPDGQGRLPACRVHPEVATFSLLLQPTDPAWGARGLLHLMGSARACYPGPGSLLLELGPGLGSGEQQRLALQRAAAGFVHIEQQRQQQQQQQGAAAAAAPAPPPPPCVPAPAPDPAGAAAVAGLTGRAAALAAASTALQGICITAPGSAKAVDETSQVSGGEAAACAPSTTSTTSSSRAAAGAEHMQQPAKRLPAARTSRGVQRPAAAAQQPQLLRAMIRYLENHAGEVVEAAARAPPPPPPARLRASASPFAPRTLQCTQQQPGTTSTSTSSSTRSGTGSSSVGPAAIKVLHKKDPAAAGRSPVVEQQAGVQPGLPASREQPLQVPGLRLLPTRLQRDEDEEFWGGGCDGGADYLSSSELSCGSSSGSDGSGDSSDADRAGGSSSEEGAAADEGAAGKVDAPGAAGAGQTCGLESATSNTFSVSLEGLQLDNIAALEAIQLGLQVCCSRCGNSSAVLTLSSEAVAAGPSKAGAQAHEASQECPGCHQLLGVAMLPRLVHEHSNVWGVLRPQQCAPLDLLPAIAGVQCSDCGSVSTMRGVRVGQPSSRSCSHCHRHMALTIAAVAFIPRGSRAARQAAGTGRRRAPTAASAAASKGAAAFNGVLVPGQPLPAFGTCKHYAHSYRWLRFPCCGMRFPCDLCHEEEEDHDVRWAQRMACGFCSREQSVAPECAHCGRKLATSGANPAGRNTRFWEGGQGCRDVRRLNKNDPHKHRGRNKTQSAKHKRVGPKPWSKELKKSGAA